MTSFAPSLSVGLQRTPSWRLLDDAALGQQIGSALHAPAYEAGVEELLADYHIEGRGETVDGVERFDATRVVDGRWVTIEIPAIEAARNPAHVERFASIALAESGLRHRSVVAVLDIGMAPDGRPFRVREAVDLEPLAQAIARDGVLPWKRIRSIALQVCGGVAAARARGLRPRNLSLVGCFRSRHSSVDEVKLGELVPLVGGPDEREQVAAIATMIEQLSGAGRTRAELAARVATLPPTELREVLDRVRSEDPMRRIPALAELGRAIAAIGQGVTAWSRVRSSSTAGIIEDEPNLLEDEMPMGATVVSCTRADAPAEPITLAGNPSSSTPRVIVGAGLAATTIGGGAAGTLRRREPPPPIRGGRVVAWLVLAGLVGAATLHVTVPELWPNVAAKVRAGVEAIERGFRGLEPGDLAAQRGEVVPMADVAPPAIAMVVPESVAEPEPVVVAEPKPAAVPEPAAPIVAAPIVPVPFFAPSPPPPELVASPAPTRERRRAKRRPQPRIASTVVEDVPRAIDPIAAEAPAPATDEDPQPVEVQGAVLHPTATIE